jgi:hypothetical protein
VGVKQMMYAVLLDTDSTCILQYCNRYILLMVPCHVYIDNCIFYNLYMYRYDRALDHGNIWHWVVGVSDRKKIGGSVRRKEDRRIVMPM